MPFDHETMPDISVGIAWSKHWTDNNLESKHGGRCKFKHIFPEDFPQKDPMAWIYPVEALGEFRLWMDNIYISEKFGKYLNNKVKKGGLTNVDILALVQAVQPVRLN